MTEKHSILFVCSGNICRSPMAEGIFRAILQENQVTDVTVKSAGTYMLEGRPASPEAVRAARRFGAELSRHRSQGVRRELIRQADLILVMDKSHLDFFAEEYPNALPKTFLLRQFIHHASDTQNLDIPDPIGASQQFYDNVAEMIAVELRRIFPRLRINKPGSLN